MTASSNRISKERLIQIASPFIALVVYGGWASHCNWSHGLGTAITAGSVQGGFAFTSTLALTSLVIWLLKRPNATAPRVFVQSSAFLVFIPVGLHLLVGTPNIFSAMAPGLVFGHAYLWGLIKQLQRPAAARA